MSDLAQWGVIDHWSAPLETFTIGRGDCEDYAIAKYVALIQAGVAAEDVRLIIVRDLDVGEDHAVVAAHLDGDWVILDNRRLMLVKDSEMRRVVPRSCSMKPASRNSRPRPRRLRETPRRHTKALRVSGLCQYAIAATAHGHDFTLPSSRANEIQFRTDGRSCRRPVSFFDENTADRSERPQPQSDSVRATKTIRLVRGIKTATAMFYIPR